MHAPPPGWGDHHVTTFFTVIAKMLLGYDLSGYYWAMFVLGSAIVFVVAAVWLAPTRETVRQLAKWLLHW